MKTRGRKAKPTNAKRTEPRDPDEYGEQAQKFWSIYVSEAEQYDANITETWKADMDSTLIFAGLFSATVTAFILESYKSLKQDSGDVTTKLLTQILSVQIATSNGSFSEIVPTIILPGTRFSPSATTVAVNTLWFLSLVCSLVAALCVILVQQWVRAYLQRVQRHNQPLRRARVRSFLFKGSEKWRMGIVVEYIPTLLHVSLFLFFVGLCVFLSPISMTVTVAVIVIIFFFLVFYALATLAPLFDPSAPYETPISSWIWRVLQRTSSKYSHHFQRGSYSRLASANLGKARTELATLPRMGDDHVARDAQLLLWTYQRITDDRELEPFLESLPGFLSAPYGERAWKAAFETAEFMSPNSYWRIEQRLLEFLESSMGHGYVETKIRERRTNICLDALFSIISRHQTESLPMLESPASVIAPSFNGVESWDDGDLLITKALCTEVLVCRRQCLLTSSIFNFPTDIQRLSILADVALKDVDDMRQQLDAVVKEYRTSGSDVYMADIGALLQVYFSVLELKCSQLTAWADVMTPNLSSVRDIPLLYWYSQLPRTNSRISYKGISHLNGDRDLHLHAHETLAFLRDKGFYPALPDMPDHPPILSPSTWFPHPRVKNDRYAIWELQPIASLLELLEPRPEIGHIVVIPTLPYTPYLDPPVQRYPPLSLAPWQGPYGMFHSILEDIIAGCAITPYLALVTTLRASQTRLDPSFISKTIQVIIPRVWPLPQGSQILLVRLLRDVLDWEKDVAPCPLPSVEITRLLSSFRLSLSLEQPVMIAEGVLGTTRTDSSHGSSFMAKMIFGETGTSPPTTTAETRDISRRIAGVYRSIVDLRGE